MNKKDKAQKEKFAELLLTGKYNQKEIAAILRISRQTACRWAKEVQPSTYLIIRKQLTKELERISKPKNYEANKDMISQLITDIERVEKLIGKARLAHPQTPQ